MATLVETLSESLLELWVARAQGKEVVGKALCYYCPDTGAPSIYDKQNYQITEHKRNILGIHSRYVYLSQCCCDAFEDASEEEKIFNHHYFCFEPVNNYVNNFQNSMALLIEERISLLAYEKTSLWRAQKGNIFMISNNPIEAGLRVYVATKLGLTVN